MSEIQYNIALVSNDLVALESAQAKLAAELYWFTWGASTHYRYTNWHETLSFADEDWEAKPVGRTEVERGTKLMSNKTKVRGPYDLAPFSYFLAYNTPTPCQLRILRYFPDGGVDKAWCLFNGWATSSELKQKEVTLLCVDKTYLLEREMLRVLFQSGCNWRVFDALCGLDRDDWKVGSPPDRTITAVNGNELTVSNLGVYANDYFTGGFLELNGHKHTILDHTNPNKIWVLFQHTDLVVGQAVILYPGCDGNLATCGAKFSNNNFLGFPFVPIENPAEEVPVADATDSELSQVQLTLGGSDNKGELMRL